MKILSNSLRLISYSNIWIALGASSFCSLYYLFTSLTIQWNVLLFVFFSTLFAYTFQRLEKVKAHIASGDRIEWMQRNLRLVQILLGIGISGGLFFGAGFKIPTLILTVVAAIISFYYVRNIPFSRQNLRDIPFLKIYFISFSWALCCVVLPWLDSADYGSLDQLLVLFSFAFLYILSITIPFDIRDILFDEDSKKTIPQIMGIEGSKIIAIVLLLISHAALLYSFPEFQIGLIISATGSSILIALATVNRPELYYSFGIDGLLLFTTASLWMDKLFLLSGN